MSVSPSTAPSQPAETPKIYRAGTLTYTKMGLVGLFAYLLWGDFCFWLMESLPGILPLKMRELGAGNGTITLLMTTIPNLLTILVNPIVSVRSDRFRSKWGRRIPFLAGATPFIVMSLVLLGFSDGIGKWLHNDFLSGIANPATVTLFVMGAFTVCFQFFNLFITSIYYYLFNDVVPEAFLARFMALFRMVSIGTMALYNGFVLEYAKSHTSLVFVGAAALYAFGFGLMCWKVKEGDYPPPESAGEESGIVGSIRTYAKECFTHRFYWLFFLANSIGAMGWGVTATFDILLATKVIGMELGFFGKVVMVAMILSALLLYPAGMLADRIHPLRTTILGWSLTILYMPAMIAFLFLSNSLGSPHAAWMWAGLMIGGVPLKLLITAAEMPMFMRLLPRERYGQFCSANALIRSFTFMLAGPACGFFLDAMQRFGSKPDDCYRFVWVWNFAFGLVTLTLFFLLHREWKRLGGLNGYKPPGAKPTGVEGGAGEVIQ